jgi:rhodanese-related sulfurtransferase
VDYLKRLAFWTIRAEEAAGASELFHLTGSKAEDIDVVITVDEVDVEKQQQALDCYVTYRETIERAGARRNIPRESDKAPVISADALFENLNDGDKSNDPCVLSVRKPEHYALGHVPGAINVYWQNVAEPDNLAKLPTDKQIVVYCYTGHTGQIAATVLNLLGYDAVNLKYGMMGWTKDDAVLAQPRFGPTSGQQDYRLETDVNEATETYDFPTVSTGGGGRL